MSRFIALLSAGVLVCAARGHAADRSLDLGVVGGLNRAGISGQSIPETDLETRTGFLFGATVGLQLRETLTLSLEPSYVVRGCRVVTEIDDRNDIEEETQVAFDYLEFPLLIRARGSGQARPYALGGVGVAFLLDATGELPDGGTVDIGGDLHTNELLAYFGGGLEAEWGSQQVYFEARYSQGLINAGRGNPTSAASLPPEFKNTGLQIVAGWKVWP
jgi:Outer membrane protein beta-barrel domain